MTNRPGGGNWGNWGNGNNSGNNIGNNININNNNNTVVNRPGGNWGGNNNWGGGNWGGNNNWGGGGIFGSRSPFLNFWNKVLFRNIGINIHPIKGPSWVNLMAYRKAGSAAAPASTRSLTELHNQLATEPVKE